jgi:hypothetical protein
LRARSSVVLHVGSTNYSSIQTMDIVDVDFRRQKCNLCRTGVVLLLTERVLNCGRKNHVVFVWKSYLTEQRRRHRS